MMIVRLEPFQHQVPENEKGEKGKKKLSYQVQQQNMTQTYHPEDSNLKKKKK